MATFLTSSVVISSTLPDWTQSKLQHLLAAISFVWVCPERWLLSILHFIPWSMVSAMSWICQNICEEGIIGAVAFIAFWYGLVGLFGQRKCMLRLRISDYIIYHGKWR
jgi:hypothetical protein